MLIFLQEVLQFFEGGLILILAFSHAKVLPCILPKRTKMQFKTTFEEAPVPIASAGQYHICII